MIGHVGSLIQIHRAITIKIGKSIIKSNVATMISNILFAILHHAVIDTDDNSIIGMPPIQFSHDELMGVYFDIFGYINGIPYILARVNILLISACSPR